MTIWLSILTYEGKYDLALAEADKAFALAPTDMNVMASAGEAAMLKGDFGQG